MLTIIQTPCLYCVHASFNAVIIITRLHFNSQVILMRPDYERSSSAKLGVAKIMAAESSLT